MVAWAGVARKPVNANSGLKVNRPINFFFTSYISCKLKFLKAKTEGQTENLIEK